MVGDFNGDGKAELAGITITGCIFYRTDMNTWTRVPGQLMEMAVGDLNGDGKSDIAGLASDGLIFYTTGTWSTG